jgi:hypothetical protein
MAPYFWIANNMNKLILAVVLMISASTSPVFAAAGLRCDLESTYFDKKDPSNWKIVGQPSTDQLLFEFLPGNKVARYMTISQGKPEANDRPWVMDMQVTNERYTIDGVTAPGTSGTVGYSINRQTGEMTGFMDMPTYSFSFKGTCATLTLPVPKL